jgi:glycerophosphoryl diester phosphodiesterase
VSARKSFVCIGHRGASGTEPENTLRSIRRALELGADGVEIDVRLIEGELIVFHDSRLNRTTNGKGYVARKSFAALRALDAGLGEQIPTLREVCQTVNRRGFINIELKGRGTALPTAAVLRELIGREGWEPAHFLVSSFLRRELRTFREADPITPVGLLLARPTRLFLGQARALQASAIHPPLKHTNKRLIEMAHQNGLRVLVYTVNEPASLARMRALGVDGVFTDFPERVK